MLLMKTLAKMSNVYQNCKFLSSVGFLLAIPIIYAICTTSIHAQETMRDRIRERIKERMQERAAQNAVNDSQDPRYEFEFAGLKRSYLLHVPKSYDGKTAVPLVFVFHGGGGNAQGAVRMTGMDSKADAANFIAVYPNGTGKMQQDA